MTSDVFHIHIDDRGHLRIDGFHGFVEPICEKCDKPIPWVLDMMTFSYDGDGYVANHASCVWTEEGFQEQIKRVRERKREKNKIPVYLPYGDDVGRIVIGSATLEKDGTFSVELDQSPSPEVIKIMLGEYWEKGLSLKPESEGEI